MRHMSTARRTAVASLVAAIGLALLKLAVGFASGSLGVLAEAVHSGIDAAAAGLTLYAVGVAERPADTEHPFGHGKAQHLAALGEAAFLAAAAPWYAFAALLVVLAVDAGRTGVSLRQGRIDRNAALLANAWHFASDFAGTLAVLVGLGLVTLDVPAGDSLAAIFVAVIVLLGALRLARQNIDALMDRTPSGMAGQVERAARSVPGVSEVRSVRVREAGGESFAEVVIGVPRLAGVERSHETTDMVEGAVRDELGRAQVTVHVEPAASDETLNDRVAAAALRVAGVVEAHNISVLDDASGRAVTLHVRLPENETLSSAGRVVDRLKDEIRREVGIARVFAHVEPSAPGARPARDIGAEQPSLHRVAAEAVRSVAGEAEEVVVYRQGSRLLVVTSVRADPELSVGEAHALASRVEDAVRDAIASVDDVIVEVC
jgi:divalent metal cation (Fe/Co/Zn/Cd) transporter